MWALNLRKFIIKSTCEKYSASISVLISLDGILGKLAFASGFDDLFFQFPSAMYM